jgi:hypothetical protein
MEITARQIKKLIDDNYSDHLEPLHIISKDQARNESMIPIADKFLNYDRICESLFTGKNKPKTPDMIFFKDDVIYFVEFKNGRIEGIRKKCEMRREEDECRYVKWDIKLKALEGAFIVLHRLASDVEEKINFSSIFNIKKVYILVYNNERSIKKNGKTNSRIKIADHLSANRVRFGLGIYKGTFFADVATFTPEVFIKTLHRLKLIPQPPR